MIWMSFNPKSATEVRRQVFILNPCRETLQEDGETEEIACSKDASGTVSCSRNGICGLDLVVEEVVVGKHQNHQISLFSVQKESRLINTGMYKVCGDLKLAENHAG